MKEIPIPVDRDTLHIIYSCIIEHWRMPQYEEKISAEDFALLEELRAKILQLRDERDVKEIMLSERELDVIIRAYEIGLGELVKDGDEFPTIVGHDTERGK